MKMAWKLSRAKVPVCRPVMGRRATSCCRHRRKSWRRTSRYMPGCPRPGRTSFTKLWFQCVKKSSAGSQASVCSGVAWRNASMLIPGAFKTKACMSPWDCACNAVMSRLTSFKRRRLVRPWARGPGMFVTMWSIAWIAAPNSSGLFWSACSIFIYLFILGLYEV